MIVMGIKVGLKYIEKWHSDLESQVQRYEQEQTEKGQIVFYGPSNFTRWSPKYGNPTLQEEVLGKSGKQCCVNRGFGSSCTEHHLYYYSRMVKPLEPKVLVYAPGLGNGTSFGYTPEEMFELAQRVVLYAKSSLSSTKMTIQQISDELNFPSQSVFGKYFKRVEGISPKAYRESLR